MQTLLTSNWSIKIILATRHHPLATNGLITILAKIPVYARGELMTHRRKAANSSSGRAQKGSRLVTMLGAWIPDVFYLDTNRAEIGGVVTPASPEAQAQAIIAWTRAIEGVEAAIAELQGLGIAREQYNRLFTQAHFCEVLLTATEAGWRYLLDMRSGPQVDVALVEQFTIPARALIANADWRISNWHVPFYPDDLAGQGYSQDQLLAIAAARAARISFKHPGVGKDDLALGEALIRNRHWSPFEHIASSEDAMSAHQGPFNIHPEDCSSVSGYEAWQCYRHKLENEAVYTPPAKGD